ncbi:hypothetical protein MOQ72_08140 [Saccharopolyspora sp. K220]|uniref:hypothetical protein n=1 Tax=Saccharopolyspora soli TaxID=2926618 RepID=UPI001F5AEC00|nr:hypothetical protein [Saccharopolyspora soli]MCI2417392.1 hypothetical protein [Saccharopolyspora soli]
MSFTSEPEPRLALTLPAVLAYHNDYSLEEAVTAARKILDLCITEIMDLSNRLQNHQDENIRFLGKALPYVPHGLARWQQLDTKRYADASRSVTNPIEPSSS